MSRYDYRDPGCDPAYCNALAPEPEDERDVDPRGHLYQALYVAVADLEQAVKDCDTPDEASAIYHAIKGANVRLMALTSDAVSRADLLMGRR